MKGLTLKRGLQTKNVVLGVEFDREDARAEQNAGTRRGTSRLYDPVARNEDRTLKAGEMAFSMIDPREEFTVEWDPYVRTVLNGVHVRTPDLDETDPVKREEQIREYLMNSIRLVGFIIQDVQYPGPSPNGVPNLKLAVAAVSGYMTLTITGDKRIESGDAIRCVLVDKTKKNQYRDMNKFSPGRAAIGIEPLEMHTGLYDEIVHCKAENELLSVVKEFLEALDIPTATLDTTVLMAGLEKDPKIVKTGETLLATLRAKEMHDARNVLGVAETPADGGNRFDGMITKLLNLTTFAKPKKSKQ